MKKLEGWSRNKKQFSKADFKDAYLSEFMSYDAYVESYKSQSKSKRLKKSL